MGAGACSEGEAGFSGFTDLTCAGATATGLTFVTGRVDTPDTGTTTFWGVPVRATDLGATILGAALRGATGSARDGGGLSSRRT